MEKELNILKLEKAGVSLLLNENAFNKHLCLFPVKNSDGKIGFVNEDAEIVIPTEYDHYIGSFVSKDSLVSVKKDNLFGLIDSINHFVIPMKYRGLIPSLDGVHSVQSLDYKRGVINTEGEIIVPFGVYQWIDGFDSGLARVKGMDDKWGIINKTGKVVLPVVFDEVWNFYDKRRKNTYVSKGGVGKNITFEDLLNGVYERTTSLEFEDKRDEPMYHKDIDYQERQHYEEYAGTYAQDVMGFSDEQIDDAFDGDPDAYWNID